MNSNIRVVHKNEEVSKQYSHINSTILAGEIPEVCESWLMLDWTHAFLGPHSSGEKPRLYKKLSTNTTEALESLSEPALCRLCQFGVCQGLSYCLALKAHQRATGPKAHAPT